MRLANKERAVSRQTANQARQQSFELFFILKNYCRSINTGVISY